MTLFRPELVALGKIYDSVSLLDSYDIVFAGGNIYQVYLFAALHRAIGPTPLIGCGCSEAEVEDLVKSCRRPCGLLVTDCVGGLLGDAGESLVERIKEWKPKTRAILIASERGEVLLSQGRLGIYDGIVSVHSVNQGGVLRAVEHVLGDKGRYRDPALKIQRGRDEAVVQLSGRERQVLSLLAQGKTNKEIAAALFIAEVTARDYVSGIYRKTDSGNRAEAAAWAIQHGF